MAKMPHGKSINSGLKLMHFHLSAVAAFAARTSFVTGCSDTSVVDQHGLGMDPLIAVPLRKCKSTKSINTENSRKKTKAAEQNPVADISSGKDVGTQEERVGTGGGENTREEDCDATPQERTEEMNHDKENDEKNEEEESDGFESADLGPNQCVCGYEFEMFEHLCAHRGLAYENNSFKCAGKRVLDGVATPCLEEFHTPSSMWRHYRTVHLGHYYFYCRVKDCTLGKEGSTYGSDSKVQVQKHMHEKHGIQSSMKCPRCEYVAGAKWKLRDHLEVCKIDKRVKKHQCSVCAKAFQSKGPLAIHKCQGHPETPGDKSSWHHCGACDKVFKTISGCRKHRQTEYEGVSFT